MYAYTLRCFPTFFSLTVLDFYTKLLIHLKFIFVQDEEYGSICTLEHTMSIYPLPSTLCLRGSLLLNVHFRCLSQNQGGCRCEGSYLLFCWTGLHMSASVPVPWCFWNCKSVVHTALRCGATFHISFLRIILAIRRIWSFLHILRFKKKILLWGIVLKFWWGLS